MEDWQIAKGIGEEDTEEIKMASKYKRFRSNNYGQLQKWPCRMESGSEVAVFQHCSRHKLNTMTPCALETIEEIEKDAGIMKQVRKAREERSLAQKSS